METWRKSFVDRNVVLKIAIVNVVIYVIILFWETINGMPLTKNGLEAPLQEDQIYHPITWMALQGDFSAFITKPWTMLTFMVSHERFLALLSNMIWLCFFGSLLQEVLGNKRVIPLYIYGGFFGGIVYILFCTLMGLNFYLASASLSVFAIAAAATAMEPNYKVFTSFNGGFSLWILSAIYALLTLLTSSSAVIAAHVMAGCTGLFFIKQLQKGNDYGQWMNTIGSKINGVFDPAAKTGNKHIIVSDEEKLNKILDKISNRGMYSLSAEEKKFLDNRSK